MRGIWPTSESFKWKERPAPSSPSIVQLLGSCSRIIERSEAGCEPSTVSTRGDSEELSLRRGCLRSGNHPIVQASGLHHLARCCGSLAQASRSLRNSKLTSRAPLLLLLPPPSSRSSSGKPLRFAGVLLPPRSLVPRFASAEAFPRAPCCLEVWAS